MSNYITASVEFYYKGEKHSSSIELDMDQHMCASGELPDLYPLLAQTMNIGAYSYEYEMALAETIMFSHATGLAADYVNDGILDFDGFRAAYAHFAIVDSLQIIAKKHMGVDDLKQNSNLMNALLEAYQLSDAGD